MYSITTAFLVISWYFAEQSPLTPSPLLPLPKNSYVAYKKKNNCKAHAQGNKLLDNSSLTIVNSEHDIVCWIQPIRYFAKNIRCYFYSP